MHTERKREARRHGHRHRAREPSAVGLSYHLRNVGKGGDTIGRWQEEQSTN